MQFIFSPWVHGSLTMALLHCHLIGMWAIMETTQRRLHCPSQELLLSKFTVGDCQQLHLVQSVVDLQAPFILLTLINFRITCPDNRHLNSQQKRGRSIYFISICSRVILYTQFYKALLFLSLCLFFVFIIISLFYIWITVFLSVKFPGKVRGWLGAALHYSFLSLRIKLKVLLENSLHCIVLEKL